PETAATMPLVSRHLMTRVKRRRELDMVDLALRLDGRNRCGFRSKRKDSLVQYCPGHPDRRSCTIPSFIVIASRQSRKAQPCCAPTPVQSPDPIGVSSGGQQRRALKRSPGCKAAFVAAQRRATGAWYLMLRRPTDFASLFRELLSGNWRLEQDVF